MMFEIKGVQFVNKGAELMLMAIIEQVRGRYPDARFVLTNRGDYATFQSIARLGCYQKLYINRRGYNLLAPFALVPERLLLQFGLVPESGVDVVLDASGFVYHSQGGMPYIRETARRIRKWRRSGKKVIFLPQAFGPFQGAKVKKWMVRIIDNADLVFARDALSHEYLSRIKDSGKIVTCPDFTNLVDGYLPESYRRLEGRVPIITNYGMIHMLPEEESRKYVPLMSSAMNYLVETGCQPYFLMHEDVQDRDLVHRIMEHAGREIEVISEEDPLAVKGIIGAARGVLSSRFHGLVSALSRGVPALGTGWSHKYEALFSDYEFQEGLLSLSDSPDLVHERLSYITDGPKNEELRQKLEGMSEIQKKLSREMWSRVFAVIDGTGDVAGNGARSY